MLFQFGALFTDMTVFENVAFPMREHTDLPDAADPRPGPDEAARGRACAAPRGSCPSELSGGMARRVALARAVALDPMLVMYDEPFAGLDPISLGVVGQLIRKLNDALGITSVVVTHDVYESLKIVDYLYFVSEGRIVAQGTPDEVRALDRSVRAPVRRRRARRPGAVPLSGARRTPRNWPPVPANALANGMRRVGAGTIRAISRVGLRRALLRRGAAALAGRVPAAAAHRARDLLRGRAVAGGHHGVRALRRHGAGPAGLRRAATSTAPAIRSASSSASRSCANSGPVVAGLLFASRAGSAVTAEIGLMKTTEQLSAMEMMAVDPLARIVAPRFWGGVISMPLLAALFSVMGVFGAYLVGVRLIGVDNGTFWGNMQAGIEFWPDVTNGIIKSVVFGIAVSLIAVFEGYDAKPTAEGVSAATTRTVVGGSLAILALDFILTVFMFRGLGNV